MWQKFEADSADLLWDKVITAMQNSPDSVEQPSRVGYTREIMHATLSLADPRQRWIFGKRPAINPAFALAEVIWIVRGRRDAQFLVYFNHSFQRFVGTSPLLHGAYGYRLRSHFGVDQLEQAYTTLRSNPDSRQVALQFWDARADLPQENGKARDPDIPCNTQSFLKVRKGKLEWVQMLRSNDIHLGLPHNLIQFTCLQEIMAGWLDIESGMYHHLSDSLHIYEHDLQVISTQSVQAPKPESLALPKAESDRVFTLLESAVETIIDANISATDLYSNLNPVPLPAAYKNILQMLLAEGLRRRKAPELATAAMSHCTNEGFQMLWLNWLDRLSHTTQTQMRR